MLLYVLGPVALWLVWRWYRESKRVDDKEQKYVYITGCDTGFGNHLAKRMDALGFRVIAGCYTEKGEDELRKSASDRLTTVQLDVADSESVSRAADHIKALVGQKGECFLFLYTCPIKKKKTNVSTATSGSLSFNTHGEMAWLHQN